MPASALDSAMKSSFFATKSVSQLTSTLAADLPAALMALGTMPSAATRPALLAALLPKRTRRISSAFCMSPPASDSAFLQSIIGASVFSRRSLTMLAVISAISNSYPKLLDLIQPIQKEGPTPLLEYVRRECPPAILSTSRLFSRDATLFFHFDELLATDDLADDLGTAFQRRIGHAAGVQANRARRVIVAGDDVVHAFRAVVGVDHADHRNAQLLGLDHGALLVADVDDEQRVGQAAHFTDAAQAAVQLVDFALDGEDFLLRQTARFGQRGFQFVQAFDGLLDRLEVRQHAAEPAVVDVRHAGALRFFAHDVACGALGADEQHVALVGGQLAHEFLRLLEHRQRFFQVNDMDLVAMTENERGHLGVPEAGLVAEMDTGLQHLAHGDRHENLLKGCASTRQQPRAVS